MSELERALDVDRDRLIERVERLEAALRKARSEVHMLRHGVGCKCALLEPADDERPPYTVADAYRDAASPEGGEAK